MNGVVVSTDYDEIVAVTHDGDWEVILRLAGVSNGEETSAVAFLHVLDMLGTSDGKLTGA